MKADQHYTRKHRTFTRPLRKQGWEIVMNQPVDERTTFKPITAGIHKTPLLIHCGTILPVWTPPNLLDPPDDPTDDSAFQDWCDKLEKYRWRVVYKYSDGRIKIICPQCSGRVMTTAKNRNAKRPDRTKVAVQPVTAVPDTEYCCDGMITLQVDQLDNYQRNAYGTTDWATDYAHRNPVEGVNGMIKNDGSFDRKSCRAFGLAAHTLAALAAIVIHNLDHTRRTRRPKHRDNITAHRPEQATPDTTPPDAPHPHPDDPTPIRAPP